MPISRSDTPWEQALGRDEGPDFLPPAGAGADPPAALPDGVSAAIAGVDRIARARRALAAAEEAAAGGGGRFGADAPGGTTGRRGGRASVRRGDRRRPSAEPPPPDAATEDAEPGAHDVARQIVLRQLAMAPRSRAQLEQKLRDKGCDDRVAGQVLDRMEEVGLVDDEAFAGMLVRSQHATRGLARPALRRELRRKGVDPDTIDVAIEQVSDDDERDEARRLIEKKMRTMHGLPAQTQARRLAGMLARKGYSGEVAYSLIREAVRDAPEHQRD